MILAVNMCDNSSGMWVIYIIKLVISIICIITPLIIMFNAFKLFFGSSITGDKLKENAIQIFKNLIAGLIIFMIPSGMNFIFGTLVSYDMTSFSSCYTQASLEGIKTLKANEKKLEDEKKKQQEKELVESFNKRYEDDKNKNEEIKKEKEQYQKEQNGNQNNNGSSSNNYSDNTSDTNVVNPTGGNFNNYSDGSYPGSKNNYCPNFQPITQVLRGDGTLTGCQPTSMAMIGNAFNCNKSYSESEIGNLLGGYPAYTYTQKDGIFADYTSLKYKEYHNLTHANISAELKNGRIFRIMVQNYRTAGSWSQNGVYTGVSSNIKHSMIMFGYDNGNVTVFDPADGNLHIATLDSLLNNVYLYWVAYWK